jgi:hypothetical protein
VSAKGFDISRDTVYSQPRATGTATVQAEAIAQLAEVVVDGQPGRGADDLRDVGGIEPLPSSSRIKGSLLHFRRVGGS